MLDQLKDKLLSEVAPESILIIDDQSKILYVNNSFEQVFGYSREEAVGKDLSIIQSPSLATLHKTGISRYLKSGERKLNWQSTRTFALTKDKTEFPIEISFSHVHMNDTHYFAAFIKDISEVVAKETQIARQHEELRKKNEELDNFAYRVSHDLRAPLLSVLGLLNIYRLSPEQEDQLIIIDNIEKSIKKLDRYIHEIIDISKNERLESQLIETNVASLIQGILDDLRYMDAFANIDKRIEIDFNHPVYIDAFRFKVIGMNIISNAIRYHNRMIEHPRITISVTKTDSKLHLKVMDNGIGMTEKTQERLFEMYYRGSDLSSGSGLGMYIVQEMVAKMGGQISVQSELGVGSTFNVTIPYRETI